MDRIILELESQANEWEEKAATVRQTILILRKEVYPACGVSESSQSPPPPGEPGERPPMGRWKSLVAERTEALRPVHGGGKFSAQDAAGIWGVTKAVAQMYLQTHPRAFQKFDANCYRLKSGRPTPQEMDSYLSKAEDRNFYRRLYEHFGKEPFSLNAAWKFMGGPHAQTAKKLKDSHRIRHVSHGLYQMIHHYGPAEA